MDLILHPRPLAGTVAAIPSKSWAHRLLLGAALSGEPTLLSCGPLSRDIQATMSCLSALGAELTYQNDTVLVHPGRLPGCCRLPCGESGSTLRLLLPVVAALGIHASFFMEGRLPSRPLAPLGRELEAHGVRLSRPEPGFLQCRGKLEPGSFRLPGNVSSQFISGLLFALPLLDRESTLTVTGPVESEPYLKMTLAALELFGIHPTVRGAAYFLSPASYRSPGQVHVEGDWSNAAFWLCAGALGGGVTVAGLNRNSLQGDRAICTLLSAMGAGTAWSGSSCTAAPGPLQPLQVDARSIPDLVPILAVTASAAPGTTRVEYAGRLRLKESDRLEALCRLLQDLGGSAFLEGDCLVVQGGTPLTGGAVRSYGDHRIAMAAAVADNDHQPVFVPARYASLAQRPSQNPIPGSGRITRAWEAFGRRSHEQQLWRNHSIHFIWPVARPRCGGHHGGSSPRVSH